MTRGTARITATALGLLLCLPAQCTTGRVAESVTDQATPAERLFIAVLGFDEELDELAQSETARLLGICDFYGAACFSQHFVPLRHAVAVLRSRPDSTSPVTGHIHAVLKVSGGEHDGLRFDLEVEAADAPGRYQTWLRVGDWGYGIYVSGVRPSGNWVQLHGEPLPPQAWLSTEESRLSVQVLTISGEILDLRSVHATTPDGRLQTIADGSYIVTGISGSLVEFRAEIPADMACGQPVESPDVMPPALRAPPAEFFDADGTPRFALRHQKGC